MSHAPCKHCGIALPAGADFCPECAFAERTVHTKPYELGILLVHGIGQQQRGQTLIEMGEPMAAWIRHWIEGAAGSADASEVRSVDSPVIVRSAALNPDASSDPAHVELEIGGDKKHWVIAEAWWAESFRPATFGELVGWGLLAGPFALTGQVATIASRATISARTLVQISPPALKVPAGFVAVTASVMLIFGVALLSALGAAALTTVSAVLLALAVLPVPWLRDFVLRVQLGLANGLGDSYVLANSPFRYTSMLGRFKESLAWVSDRSARVVVVAHSQGSMLAYEALRESRPPNVRVFITFGQAIRKLRILREIGQLRTTTKAGAVFWALAAVSSVALIAALWLLPVVVCGVYQCASATRVAGWGDLPARFVDFVTAPGPGVWFLGALSLTLVTQGVLLVIARLDDSQITQKVRREVEHMGLAQGEFEWWDFFASADPVPNGVLLSIPWPSGFCSIKVRNRGSNITDHTSYWAATSDFVMRVARRLALMGGVDLRDTGASREDLWRAQRIRSHRVAWLGVSRLIGIGTWIALISVFGFGLPAVGDAVGSTVHDWNSAIASWILGLAPLGKAAIVAVLLAALQFSWYGVGIGLWGAVTAHDERRMFDRAVPGFLTLPFAVYVGWVVLMVIAGASIVMVRTDGLWPVGWYLGGLAVASFVFVVFLRMDERWQRAHSQRSAPVDSSVVGDPA